MKFADASTETRLLALTEGRITLTLAEAAQILGITMATAENQIYKRTLPVPAFKIGVKWVVDVRDMAAYFDRQRALAIDEFESR